MGANHNELNQFIIFCFLENILTQLFELTLSILVKGLPSPNSDHNPVADRFTGRSDLMGSRSLPRNLQIPWLPDDNLPEGIEPAESWQRWLQPLQNRRGAGFAITAKSVTRVTVRFSDLFYVYSNCNFYPILFGI